VGKKLLGNTLTNRTGRILLTTKVRCDEGKEEEEEKKKKKRRKGKKKKINICIYLLFRWFN
jgi:hypothetical protein